MNLKTWEFTGGPFHFGRRGLGQEITAVSFSSDSLFAALISRLAELEGAKAIESFMEPFLKERPPLVLSSLFPRAGTIRFFPVPAARGRTELKEGISYKDLKKMRFLSEKLFLRIIQGEDIQTIFSESEKLQGGIILAEPSEAKGIKPVLWKEEKRPRVTLDRQTQTSSLFFTGGVHFAEGCGLWAAANVADESILKQMDLLMTELGEAGLGAERSVGMGRCVVKRGSDLNLPEPSEGGLMVTLGHFLPKKNQTQVMQVEGASYKLETIGGWVTSPQEMNQRRRIVRMVTEGAVLGALKGIPGDLVDVRPVYDGETGISHPVWRNGQVLSAGFTPAGNGEIK